MTWPPAPHPDDDGGPATLRRHSDWLVRHGLVPAAELHVHHGYALPELVRRACPQAPRDERDLLRDVLGWYTVLDDRLDGPLGGDPARARALVGLLTDTVRGDRRRTGRGRPPAPWARGVLSAWEELWERQCRGRTEVWRRRAARDWTGTLQTFVAAAGHRDRGTRPPVAEAALLRRHSSGLYPFMNLLERAEGAEVPDGLRVRGDWHRLRAHTADASALINDLFSLAREERREDRFNMVVVLQRERGLSREQSRAAVREEVSRLREASDALRLRLAREHPGCGGHLEGTRLLVDAVYAWSGATGRYRGPKSQLPGVSVDSLV